MRADLQIWHHAFKLILSGLPSKRAHEERLLLTAELAQLSQQMLEGLRIHGQTPKRMPDHRLAFNT